VYRKQAKDQDKLATVLATENEKKTFFLGRMFLKYFYTSFD